MRKSVNRKQIIIISLISLLLAVTAVGIDVCLENGIFSKAETAAPEEVSTTSEASKASTGYIYSEKISSKLTDIEDEPYVEGPDVLNLAYYYPEGADTSDVMNSFAGNIYKNLAVKDADYFSTIYDMGDGDPLTMARELGYDSSKVMGKYNPTVPGQDPENPATWSVNRFKNVNVAFYDGDGNRINGYSNVKEIMAMASVYSYYHDMTDAEAMEQYANELWSRSHSYTISIGDVYYCSGCLNKTIQDEAREAIEQERRQIEIEEALAQNTAASSGDASLSSVVYPEVDFTIEEIENGTEAPRILYAPTESESESTSAESSVTPTPGSESESPAPQIIHHVSEPEDTESSTAETTATSAIVTESDSMQSAQTAAADSPTIELQSAAAGSDGLSYSGVPLDSMFMAMSSNDIGISIENIGNTPADTSSETAAATEATSAEAESVNTIISPGANMAGSPESTEASAYVSSENEAGESTAADTNIETTEALTETEVQDVSEIVGDCPGHVDLYITVTLYGIDDINGLMAIDPIGNDPANFNDRWQGWTEEAKASARSLNSADWFKRYGLTISAINVRNPLSESEINTYLDRMPADISQQRKDIVSFALHSVGKVPYYWGGKPNGPGYEANSFGVLMYPDTKGRVLKGLDCSGWINWVYWSVLGTSLPGESTGTLIGCGERIQRSDLKPGDIMVRIGAEAHVVMFIEWAQNGNMVVVHETGGAINNVTVSEMSADWPYYRKLIN